MQQSSTALSIVIPAFNEADRLPATLAKISVFYSQSRQSLGKVDLLVVDDGSQDDTAGLARSVTTPSGMSLRVLGHRRNLGKGAAVRTGFAASRGRLVLLCDADLATPIEDVLVFLEECNEGSVVIGSRALDRSLILVRQPLLRDFMGRVFNLMVQALVLPGIWDSQCGFKLFPGPWARRLATEQRLSGFAFDVELLARSRAAGLTVREVGVHWRHVEASRVLPGRHSAQMFRDLLRVAVWRASGQLAPKQGRR